MTVQAGLWPETKLLVFSCTGSNITEVDSVTGKVLYFKSCKQKVLFSFHLCLCFLSNICVGLTSAASLKSK